MHERALRSAAASLGMHFTHEQSMARYIGCSDADAYTLICEDNGRTPTPLEFEELSRFKWEAAAAAIHRGEAPPYPGTIALIRAACDAGVPVAVCSGARRHEIELILELLGLRESFGAVVTADEVVSAKPDPTGYRLAAAHLGMAPGECVAIEDTTRGISAAIAAGMRVIAVGHTLSPDRLSEAHDYVPDSQRLTLERVLRA